MSDDDEERIWEEKGKKKAHQRWTEYDCPLCSANNPMDDGFSVGDDVVCQYCGVPFRVRPAADGGYRLVE